MKKSVSKSNAEELEISSTHDEEDRVFRATVFNVMIASPWDVSSERRIVRDVVLGWNAINAGAKEIVLLPVGWETHSYPAMGDHPQNILNEQVLASCDLLVAIFGSRIGTPTNRFISGTVEEIETHLEAGKPVMIYFYTGQVSLPDHDPEQYRRLEEFRESCRKRGLYETFGSHDDFKEKFSRQLDLMMINDKYFLKNFSRIAHPEAEPALPRLSDEAKKLLKEATKDPDGRIIHYRGIERTYFITNNREFRSEDPRSQAAWANGFQELENQQLIKAEGPERIEFQVTLQGYDLADGIF